jgi:hypothetical protein
MFSQFTLSGVVVTTVVGYVLSVLLALAFARVAAAKSLDDKDGELYRPLAGTALVLGIGAGLLLGGGLWLAVATMVCVGLMWRLGSWLERKGATLSTDTFAMVMMPILTVGYPVSLAPVVSFFVLGTPVVLVAGYIL